MGEQIGIAVVGCGRISEQHLLALATIEEAKLVSVTSRREARAKAVAEKHGVPRYHANIHEAVTDSEVDAVFVLVPNYAHAEVAVLAAQAGKHVLVEKPLANTTAEADRIIAAADENGVKLMVGQSRRFYKAVMESRERLREIGRPFNLMATWVTKFPEPATPWWKSIQRAGGLLIAMNASHVLDWMLWLMGTIPERVYAETLSINPEWDGEDEVTIVLGFREGAIATVHLSFNTEPGFYERYVVGDRGSMKLVNETQLFVNGEAVVQEDEEAALGTIKGFSPNFAWQAREFISALLEGREPMASGVEVRKTIQVMEAARLSALSHEVVRPC